MAKIALSVNWRDDFPGAYDFDLSALLGQVTKAEFSVWSDTLRLTYADGRTLDIHLHQCRTHACDETCMVIDTQPEV